jgi:23S rRNA (adenine1618-N6)-methyltransferase
MCNPPFYASQEEMLNSAETKSHVPFSACTGAAVEMIAPGGEVEFVIRMLGKLSSVTTLAERLTEHNNKNYAVTEFVQGNKTKRWAVAWSWGDRRPAMVRVTYTHPTYMDSC